MIKTNITGIGDPFVLLVGETYYLYATDAPDGFKYFTSDNLIDWKEGGYCYSKSGWGENCFWAPEVYFYRGKYYLLYTARWNKNHSLRTGLAVSDSPKGPFIDIKDGPLFDSDYATIDATFYIGDKNYLYFVRDCSENVINGVHTSQIYAVEVDETLTRFIGEPKMISTPDEEWETRIDPEWRWNEGPVVIFRNGRYYLNFSVNCYDNRNYCVGAAEADSPLGPFVKYKDNPVLKYVENEFSGPGHNAIFTAKDGKLMTSFHIHTNYDKPSGDRRACFGEVVFDEEGRMKIVI